MRPDQCNLYSDEEAAKYLGTTPATLRKSRVTGTLWGCAAPNFVKFGRVVRYSLEELNLWIEMNGKVCSSTADYESQNNAKSRKSGDAHNRADLRGQRFGKLTVLYAAAEKASNGSVLWMCSCDCGKEAKINTQRLRSGRTISCGCLRGSKISHLNEIRLQRS